MSLVVNGFPLWVGPMSPALPTQWREMLLLTTAVASALQASFFNLSRVRGGEGSVAHVKELSSSVFSTSKKIVKSPVNYLLDIRSVYGHSAFTTFYQSFSWNFVVHVLTLNLITSVIIHLTCVIRNFLKSVIRKRITNPEFAIFSVCAFIPNQIVVPKCPQINSQYCFLVGCQ